MALATWKMIQAIKGHGPVVRWAHVVVLLALWSSLLPVLLNVEKRMARPVEEMERGVVLVDVSASVEGNNEAGNEIRAVLEKLGESKHLDVQVINFSDGCLPPNGRGEKGGGTDFSRALLDAEAALLHQPADWIWVLSDGIFSPPGALPKGMEALGKYFTKLSSGVKGDDIGVSRIRTDPVWYTRTTSDVRAQLFRSVSGEAREVDVLCFVDGELAGTTRARFDASALETEVVFSAMSPHLGTAHLEVGIAEGQGGVILENDRMAEVCKVIRDKIRILRVVGRPTWDSKFLRDMIVAREDIDLIDFHILRSMQDLQAPNRDLALIPFPVNELFVENIDSFDLIIWQNFDALTYSFFKNEYLENIVKFTRGGGGLLVIAGHLPWDYYSEVFGEVVAQRGRGEDFVSLRQPISISSPDHRLLSERLRQGLSATGSLDLDLFTGPLNKDAKVLLEVDGHPLLSLRDFGKGRTVSVSSDGLWQLGFRSGAGDNENLYDELFSRVLLWLQHHPDLVATGFEMPDVVRAGGIFSLQTTSGAAAQVLRWKKVGSGLEEESHLKGEGRQHALQAPRTPGVYMVSFDGTSEAKRVGVRALEGEFLPLPPDKLWRSRLTDLGFGILNLKESPLDHPRGFSATRTTGTPIHHNWIFLIWMSAVVLVHWLLVSSTQRKTFA